MMRATILLYYLNKSQLIHTINYHSLSALVLVLLVALSHAAAATAAASSTAPVAGSHQHHQEHKHHQHMHQQEHEHQQLQEKLQYKHQEPRASALNEAKQDTQLHQHVHYQSGDTGGTSSNSAHHQQQQHQQAFDEPHHKNVHKLMSEQDLRRTFQVHTHDQVPEYEILTKLTVQGLKLAPQQDRRNSDEVVADTSDSPTTTASSINGAAINAASLGLKSSSSSSCDKKASDKVSCGDDEGVKNNGKRRAVNDDDDNEEIVMNLSTFGKNFKLRLKRNVEFQQRIKDMKMFMAESTKDGQLRYTEIKSHMGGSSNDNQQQQQQKRAQSEPVLQHKRAANADELLYSAQSAAQASALDSTAASGTATKKSSSDASASASAAPMSSSSVSDVAGSVATATAAAAAAAASPATTAKGAATTTKKEQQQQQQASMKKAEQQSSGAVWNIGSTYHDEDNLAALLIDHDTATGQLRVDGTIGNDFVIKPMPQATIDALQLKRQQQQQHLQQQQLAAAAAAVDALSRSDSSLVAANNGNNQPAAAAAAAANSSPAAKLDLARSSANNNNTSSSSSSSNKADQIIKTQQQQQQLLHNRQQAQADGMERAMHMHDDDPHDDDEMFLDEDEAIELALHLQQQHSSNFSNTTTTNKLAANDSAIASAEMTTSQQQQQPHLPQQPRALSKAASERKWKKYRKLMAQTQVPKPNSMQQQQQQHQTSGAGGSSSFQQQQQQLDSGSRARRHAHSANQQQQQQQRRPEVIQVSHHIVYRQKPSAESSSSEHQHSFMVAPSAENSGNNNDDDDDDSMRSARKVPALSRFSAASMEQMAISFSAQRLTKRAATTENNNNNEAGDDNMIDIHSTKTDSHSSTTRNNPNPNLNQRRLEPEDEADYLHDPLGGQFYLEPGSITGFERAGFSDWSLMSGGGALSGRRGNMAPPPYALNGTSQPDEQYQYEQSLNETISSSNNTSSKHNKRRFKRQSSGGRHEQQHMGSRLGSASSQVRRKRQAPDTVWPEVLLVVDYDSFLLHGGDSRDVKRYFVSFWNGVDLRYKLLVHPHIRISLAGMIVAKDRDATPYLERNRLRAPNADAVDAAGALTDMGKYLYREDRLPTYDLAVVITKLDMCRRRYEGGRCNRGTAGFAYVGGACVVNKRLEKVNSVAIIEDSGGFSGIIVAAHEVGHLLGCVHDGSPPPSYLGGPGATHCPWEDGFIMSDLRHTERGFRWSQCSVEQFKHFLNGETATCLYNYPHESQMLHRLLPGTMLSLDEQCKRDRGTNACFKDARVCAQLFCFDSASGYCVSYRPAAEGSPCGEGQVCRNGKCVGEIENIIPDYTHQSQTVVAARGRASAGNAHSLSAGRLADNGLSASSTSTATSSPDNKLVTGSAALPPVAANQLTSRMDTFPIDTPLNSGGPTSSAANAHFGGRYSSAPTSPSTASNGLMLMRQQQQQHHQQQQQHLLGSTPAVNQAVPGYHLHQHQQQQYQHHHHHHHPSAQMKSAKLLDYSGVTSGNINTNNNIKHSSYQQRSGHQAISKGANHNRAALSNKQFNNNNNNNNNIHHNSRSSSSTLAQYNPTSSSGSTGSGQLYTSASTMSHHQYPPISSSSSSISSISSSNSAIGNNNNYNNNNLLTSSSPKFKSINV